MCRTKFLLLFFLFSITCLQLTIADCKLLSVPTEYPGRATDSIGVVKKNGKVYILHKVEPKETLYGLSKRYGIPVEEIKEANPEIEQGLKIAQVIRVPLIKNTESINKSTTASISKGKKIHVVKQSQTLFSISKMYGITVDDIKKWNDLPGNDIKIGQPLVVGKSLKNKTLTNNEKVSSEGNKKDDQSEIVQKTHSNTGISEKESNVVYTKTGGYKKVIEKGLAEMISDKDFDNTKYLALHRIAPVGTIMHVKNAKNGVSVFVRIIGTLSDNQTNENVVLKISKKAFDRLFAEDKKFAVVISYIP
ncbi:MAG: LysM peptidoglycan-binding domain-containing protein [Cytophagales bacterium]|nr:LysM peptidoglycan-binding domain-containing protein [Cytophagales bacterium]